MAIPSSRKSCNLSWIRHGLWEWLRFVTYRLSGRSSTCVWRIGSPKILKSFARGWKIFLSCTVRFGWRTRLRSAAVICLTWGVRLATQEIVIESPSGKALWGSDWVEVWRGRIRTSEEEGHRQASVLADLTVRIAPQAESGIAKANPPVSDRLRECRVDGVFSS